MTEKVNGYSLGDFMKGGGFNRDDFDTRDTTIAVPASSMPRQKVLTHSQGPIVDADYEEVQPNGGSTDESKKPRRSRRLAGIRVNGLRATLDKKDEEIARLRRDLEAEATSLRCQISGLERSRGEEEKRWAELEKSRQEAEAVAAEKLGEERRRADEANQERINRLFDPVNRMMGRPDPNVIAANIAEADGVKKVGLAKLEEEQTQKNIEVRNQKRKDRSVENEKRKRAGRERKEKIKREKEGARLQDLATPPKTEIPSEATEAWKRWKSNTEQIYPANEGGKKLARHIQDIIFKMQVAFSDNREFYADGKPNMTQFSEIAGGVLRDVKSNEGGYLEYPLRLSIPGKWHRMIVATKDALLSILKTEFMSDGPGLILIEGGSDKDCEDFAEFCMSDEVRDSKKEAKRKLVVLSVVQDILEKHSNPESGPALNTSTISYLGYEHPVSVDIEEVLKKEGAEFVTEQNKQEVMDEVRDILNEEEKVVGMVTEEVSKKILGVGDLELLPENELNIKIMELIEFEIQSYGFDNERVKKEIFERVTVLINKELKNKKTGWWNKGVEVGSEKLNQIVSSPEPVIKELSELKLGLDFANDNYIQRTGWWDREVQRKFKLKERVRKVKTLTELFAIINEIFGKRKKDDTYAEDWVKKLEILREVQKVKNGKGNYTFKKFGWDEYGISEKIRQWLKSGLPEEEKRYTDIESLQ